MKKIVQLIDRSQLNGDTWGRRAGRGSLTNANRAMLTSASDSTGNWMVPGDMQLNAVPPVIGLFGDFGKICWGSVIFEPDYVQALCLSLIRPLCQWAAG